MTDRSPPESKLQLEWVYGYRGHQCRNNLYYLASGEIVYFVAGVGVVCSHDDEKRQQRFFLGHSDDIISLALHPDQTLVATGQIGKEPFICVWDPASLDTVSILQGGHERGVAAVGFSGDGKLLASVGLDDYHTLNVWDWKKGRILSSARGHNDRIFDVQFNPFLPNTLVTCGVKHIKFWSLSGNSLSGRRGIFGRVGELQSILCAVFASEEVCYSGTLSGDVYKWSGHALQSVIKRVHLGAIYSIHSSESGFATGSKDGTVKLWDKEFKTITQLDVAGSSTGYKGLVVRSVCWAGKRVLVGTRDGEVYEVLVEDRTHPRLIVGGHAEGELWALATHPSNQMFATGSDDKTVRVWRMSDRSLLARSSTPHAVRSLAYSPDGEHLSAGMQDGSFAVLSAHNLSQLALIKKRKEVLHEMKYSPDGQFLAVGSNDNFVDIYSVSNGYKHVGKCSGSSSFITHIDWSVDSQHLQTNSGASERLYYQMPSGNRVTVKSEIQGIHWASWTGVLGTEVNGIWPKYSQLNDVNATHASFDHQVIVTGDDFGLVKLFRFPSVKKGAKFRKYIGHSAHVTNVRFTHNQSHVISVGGADNAIFQWRFVSPEGGVANEDEDESMWGAGSEAEGSDSELSDVASLDSDLEREGEMNYDRAVAKEDIQLIKKTAKKEAKISATKAKEGSGIKASSDGRKSGAPTTSLSLSFVHGYRGYDCRNNLYYTSTGEVVYHVAAVGVVYNKTTHSQRFYTAHTDDILCLNMHPSQDLLATGQIGKDPAIHVWEAGTLETLSILKGHHERGVCAVAFSPSGKQLASVGLDNHHSIVVWGWKKGEKLATSRGHGDKIFMICWGPFSSDKLVTVGIKHIKFWTRAGGGFVAKQGIYGKKGRATTQLCVEYGTVGGRCFTGGADGKVYHWEGRQLAQTVDAHKGPVYAIQRVEKGFISGGKDGVVALWDEAFTDILKTYALHSSAVGSGHGQLFEDTPPIRALNLGQGKILVGTRNSEILEIDRSGPIQLLIQGHMEGEVWGLAAHPRSAVCVSVSDDGAVRVWDLTEHRMTQVRSLGRSARSVAYSHDGGTIAVGMKDGGCEVLSADHLETIVSLHHRKEEISDVKFSPTGKYLAVASHDNFVDIYSTATRKRVGICKGASSYITHIDWDESGKLLQVNTGDSEVLYFEAPRGKQQLISRDDAGEIVWASWTCVLGESCKGVWPPYTDVTDVNAACVSHDGHVIATGDDFGYVKLFAYPSYEKHAKCKQYVGHSAHVTNVRWSHDDRSLVSLGGADTSLMVWKYSGSHDQETDQSESSMAASSYLSEDSDTDSEEEGGYDSDVDREKNMDYGSKTYAQPARDPALVKPHLQPSNKEKASDGKRGGVSRHANTTPRVSTIDTKSKVTDLSLDYIFGYRGFDTRQNVWVSPDGSVVYHAAAAGVVYNPLTRTQSFYLEHTDDIICLSMCRNSKLAHVVASGQIGRSAPVHVWDAHTKQTLSILQGAHGVGVCSVDFSSNGKLLVTVGLDQDHSLTVWRWSEGTKMAQVCGDHHRIFIAQFRPDSNTKFVSCGVKHVRFWTLAGTQLISKRGTVPKTVGGASLQTTLSLAFAPDDVTFTGTVSGDVYVWTGAVVTRVVSGAHSGPVFAMFTSLEDGLVLSAGKERSEGGGVKLWDVDMNRSRTFTLEPNNGLVRAVFRSKGKIMVGTQNSQLLEIDEKSGTVQVLVQGHSEGELWGLAVHPSAHMIITASDDKTVRTWDLNTKSLLSQVSLGVAVRSADFSPDGQRAVVGQSNGEFVLLSAKDLSVIGRKRDRSQMIQVVRFSPDGSLIAVGSNDACVDVYSSEGLARVGYCRGIPSFVTHIDWSHDSKHLQVSTGAYEKLVFRVCNGKHITDSATLEKIVWDSWTSVLGEEVVGVWPKSGDKGDVNTAHLNASGTTVATGDDFGCVKLFDGFPLPEKFAPHKKFYGHSAHVTCVRFLHDDSYLLSAGGDDSCVFVWRCALEQ